MTPDDVLCRVGAPLLRLAPFSTWPRFLAWCACWLSVGGGCALLTGKSRTATVDHNRVASDEWRVTGEVSKETTAALAAFEQRIGKIEASLVRTGAIGGTHAGGNVTTDSRTSRINAWTVLATVLCIFGYAFSKRLESARKFWDWCNGKPRQQGSKATRQQGDWPCSTG